ncbi:MAG: heat-inducible transcriptional repressor HrcA [Oscillospiraceae bacterium]|jgi:heat-inducible transcriptional repressor|nr:heat-inducible transcriptional repressor HrcA [Oscillospiraceae bacterium]
MPDANRKKQVLRAIIDRYIDTAEPVSSKSLSAELSLSPATIRNEMAELEETGLLEQPHTSAGRVPTVAAYRLYVDELMQRYRLTLRETEELNRALRNKIDDLGKLIAYAGRAASELFGLPAFALTRPAAETTVSRFELIAVDPRSFIIVALMSDESVKNKLVRVVSPIPDGLLTRLSAILNASFTGLTAAAISETLIASAERASGDRLGLTAIAAQFLIETLSDSGGGEYALSGASRLINYPEFRDPDRASRTLEYLSGGAPPGGVMPDPEDGRREKISIGTENEAEELHGSSIIVTRYALGDGADLLVGVVGPTRMDYARLLSRLTYIARGLAGLPPDGGQEL